MSRKLRFAALIRVSTERQAKRGESLRTQHTDLPIDATTLGGEIVEWYGGQEHATRGYEKSEVDRLLRDAQKQPRPFDAVIIHHEDRWSRDNTYSSSGLDLLVESGIRCVYVRSTKFDLLNHDDRFRLNLYVIIAELRAGTQTKKSQDNRISRAGRCGAPTCGKRPFGRIWDKSAEQWSVDPVKQQMMVDVAKRYLAGEAIPKLADVYDVNAASLHKTLMQRCGTTWQQKFKTIDGPVIVPVSIPALLDEQTIAAVHRRKESNKTFTHGQRKHQYLLSRMIFCEHCGYAMFGQTNHNGHRYYRHAHTRRVKPCGNAITWVNAEVIEARVIATLFDAFGNRIALEKAIHDATPNQAEIAGFREDLKRYQAAGETIEKGRDRILDLVARDKISTAKADAKLDELKQQEADLKTKIQRCLSTVSNVPTPEDVSRTVDRFAKSVVFRRAYLNCAKNRNPTWKEQRGLCELVFGGNRPDGKRCGVYIRWNGRRWKFSAYGRVMPGVAESAWR